MKIDILIWNTLISKMAWMHFAGEVDWKSGSVSGAVYSGADDLTELMTEVSSLISMENTV